MQWRSFNEWKELNREVNSRFDKMSKPLSVTMIIMNHFIEIRSLNLKAGTRDEFHRLYIEQTLPLLKHLDFDVVAHGPSLHYENTYYVIRRQREPMEAD